MAVLPALNSNVEVVDTLLLLTSLNINALCKSELQKRVNSTASMVENINKQEMAVTQQKIANVTPFTGLHQEVDICADTVYGVQRQGGDNKQIRAFSSYLLTVAYRRVYKVTHRTSCNKYVRNACLQTTRDHVQ